MEKLNLNPLRPIGETLSPKAPAKEPQVKRGDFDRLLNEMGTGQTPKLQEPLIDSGLKFSQHAVERMRSRGITIQPDEMKAIEAAVQKAANKGAKDTLVISGDKALIVSAKNNTIVTLMDKNLMKENVFTNIDSTVFV